jgi:ParB family chromosome partitioning protein
MDMFEEARAISGMIKLKNLTQGKAAVILGVSQSYVANKLRLLNFSPALQERITASGLSERHARALLRLKDEAMLAEAIEKITAMRLSVAASEALIDGMALELMKNGVGECGSGECILKFEAVVAEAVRLLRSHGIKARESVELYGAKRYITVTIDEGKT